jgi:hypothetical protein
MLDLGQFLKFLVSDVHSIPLWGDQSPLLRPGCHRQLISIFMQCVSWHRDASGNFRDVSWQLDWTWLNMVELDLKSCFDHLEQRLPSLGLFVPLTTRWPRRSLLPGRHFRSQRRCPDRITCFSTGFLGLWPVCKVCKGCKVCKVCKVLRWVFHNVLFMLRCVAWQVKDGPDAAYPFRALWQTLD